MKSAQQRRRLDRSAAWLRRARSRYVSLVIRPALTPGGDYDALRSIAERMIAVGLYAETSGVRQCMFGVLGHLHNIDCPRPRDPFSWSRWVSSNRWDCVMAGGRWRNAV